MKNAAQPNPKRVRSLKIIDDASTVRRLHCAQYDDCLDKADAEGWRGFSCVACDAFAPASPMAEKRMHRALLELALAILRGTETEEEPKCADGDVPTREAVQAIQRQ